MAQIVTLENCAEALRRNDFNRAVIKRIGLNYIEVRVPSHPHIVAALLDVNVPYYVRLNVKKFTLWDYMTVWNIEIDK